MAVVERVKAQGANVITLITVPRDMNQADFTLLAEALQRECPVILNRQGDLTVETIKPDGVRLRQNRVVREDREVVRNYALTIEVRVIETPYFRFAVAAMRMLAKALTFVTGVECAVRLSPPE